MAPGDQDTRIPAPNPLVGVVVGSSSDIHIVEECTSMLEEFGLPFELRVISAHRSPKAAEEYGSTAAGRGVEVIIAAAGKAAHLAGVLASLTTLPVIGLPIKTDDLGGIDSLLSTVQMPPGVPVATVAVNAAKNAAILAVQILALTHKEYGPKLASLKEKLAAGVAQKDAEYRKEPK